MPSRSRGFAALSALENLLKHNASSPAKQRLCSKCYNASAAPAFLRSSPVSRPNLARPFNTSLPHQKKDRQKKSGPTNTDVHVPDNKATRNKDREVDPYDYSELDTGIAKALERLKDALAKTRNAGRVSVEMIEALPVEVKEGQDGGSPPASGRSSQKVKLGDVATVVPKGGRSVQVYAQEEGHIKPLTAAILASTYSLSSTPDATNPLILNIPIPPATSETRQQAGAEAKKSLERAMQDIRMARGEAQKRFRKMELGKLVIVDELRKAHKGMEEVVKKGEVDGKKLLDGALKGLER